MFVCVCKFAWFDERKKKRVSIIYNVLSRYIDYCNSLVSDET